MTGKTTLALFIICGMTKIASAQVAQPPVQPITMNQWVATRLQPQFGWQYDTNKDGRIDTVHFDTNRDGKVDAIMQDMTADGVFDTVRLDTNFNGKIDTELKTAQIVPGSQLPGFAFLTKDLNEDGIFDSAMADTDGNGTYRTDLQALYVQVAQERAAAIEAENKRLRDLNTANIVGGMVTRSNERIQERHADAREADAIKADQDKRDQQRRDQAARDQAKRDEDRRQETRREQQRQERERRKP